jgi:hypothetical protein
MCGCCGWKPTAVTPLLAVHTYSRYGWVPYLETGYQHVWVLWMEVSSGNTALCRANILRVQCALYLETGHQHVWVLWMEVYSRDTTLGGANILRVRGVLKSKYISVAS